MKVLFSVYQFINSLNFPIKIKHPVRIDTIFTMSIEIICLYLGRAIPFVKFVLRVQLFLSLRPSPA